MAAGVAAPGLGAPHSGRALTQAIAASLALHAAVLAAALWWKSDGGATAPPGFVVEVAFLDPGLGAEAPEPQAAPAHAAAASHIEIPPVDSSPIAAPRIETPPIETPPIETPLAEPPVTTATVEPEAAPPPEPVREAVVLPLPAPPRPRPSAPAKVAPAVVEPAPSPPPQPASSQPAPQQLASAAPFSDVPSPGQGISPGEALLAAPASSTSGSPSAPAAASSSPAVVTNPRFRRTPAPPAYPRRALDLGQEGEVIVRALVGPDGESREIHLWRSSGVAALDEAALRAVRRWAFEAARVDGRPIEAWVEVPVRFHLRTVL